MAGPPLLPAGDLDGDMLVWSAPLRAWVARPRAAVLGTLAPPQPAKPPATAPAKGVALAQAIARRLVLGVNAERERPCTAFALDAAYAGYLKGIGGTHVRLFNPWKPSGFQYKDPGGVTRTGNFWDYKAGLAPTKEQFSRFFPTIRALNAAGVVVLYDFLDAVGLEDFTDALRPMVDQYISDAAGWIADAGFSPDMLVPGPVNEYAGGTNAEWKPHRDRLHKLTRAKLPEPWVLSTAPAYWGHYEALFGSKHGAYQPVEDKAVIHFWHAYDARPEADWKDTQTRFDAWSAANGGAVILNGELGPGSIGNDFNAGDWVGNMTRQCATLAKSAPCYWCLTANANQWVLNRASNDPRFWNGGFGWDPKVEQAFQAGAAAIRKARNIV